MHKKLFRLFCSIFLITVLITVLLYEIRLFSYCSLLGEATIETAKFRSQPLSQEMENFIQTRKAPGELLGIYWLESDFGEKSCAGEFSEEDLYRKSRKWRNKKEWKIYIDACRAIWDDLKYFPVPEAANDVHAGVGFVDSWMYERNYGGKRGHEGCDIMAENNVRGFYPVVSMTDGVVLHKGWLEQGGYRIGITAPGGAYFYYAHLDSYTDLDIGDRVKAGDLLGFMGDTGYSKVEGTTGNFPVHLHVGIYLTARGREISINPYPALRYLESQKIKCIYDDK